MSRERMNKNENTPIHRVTVKPKFEWESPTGPPEGGGRGGEGENREVITTNREEKQRTKIEWESPSP